MFEISPLSVIVGGMVNTPPPGDVTQLLMQWSEGNQDALDPLFNLVYPRLRQLAKSMCRAESARSLLQPTGVVNELFLKLIRQHSLKFLSRTHFFSLAASLMRRILVDNARAEGSSKRDWGVKIHLEDELVWISTVPSAELLDLDRALAALQVIDPRKVRMLELRFFLGATTEETAELLVTSKATVDREIKFARSWLAERLNGARLNGASPDGAAL
jgi:RNA polymerase sigma factor (TIGR02999 family)